MWIDVADIDGGYLVSHIGPYNYADFYDLSISLAINESDEIEISYYKGKFDAKGHFISAGEQTTETASLGLVKETVLTGVSINGPNIVFTTKDVYILKSENPGTITLDGTDCSS
jgi:hypothetical protein